MPSTHTPRQSLRVDTALWEKFGEYVGEDNRSAVLRDFIRWYCWEPGVKMPRRKNQQSES